MLPKQSDENVPLSDQSNQRLLFVWLYLKTACIVLGFKLYHANVLAHTLNTKNDFNQHSLAHFPSKNKKKIKDNDDKDTLHLKAREDNNTLSLSLI